MKVLLIGEEFLGHLEKMDLDGNPTVVVLGAPGHESQVSYEDWIADQPWSDGNVGMIGGSHVGWTQLATASNAPAALKGREAAQAW